MQRQTFNKTERIRKKREFQAVYQQGVRFYSRNFIIIAYRNPSGARRLGITVGKKVGNAVKRNRIKRFIREFFRLNKQQFSPAQDFVIMSRWVKGAKAVTPPMKYRDVSVELENLLKKVSHA